MKLDWFCVREFQSVKNSGIISVGDVTCLVGKNEAGKSALLKALYRLNPIVKSEGAFSVTLDYPRREVEDYNEAVLNKKRKPATPIEAGFTLDKEEVDAITEVFGSDCLRKPELVLSKTYNDNVYINISIDEAKALEYLINSADFSEQTNAAMKSAARKASAISAILKTQEQTAEVIRVNQIVQQIEKRQIDGYVYDEFLEDSLPVFLYFDEYYQMSGHENIELLTRRETSNTLLPSDHPMLGLIRLARLKLNDLVSANSTIELRNKLEGASNHLSRQVLKYWSQNKHLKMSFDVRPARPGDPVGMQQGTNIWGGVYDTRHEVTTELGSRSRGFVWFFSFLAWYSDVKRNGKQTILLLDEPGLTLHGRAQYDLLRYFETELVGSHQLLYTTHSPFMIDPQRLDRVRIVQDKSIDTDDEDTGTEVLKDIFAGSNDSLFPLQGAIGYDLHQTLFVGPNSLVVEGAADLLYLQAMSSILQEEGHAGLDPRWTITPVGGAAKVPTFVALLGVQQNMIIATLIDTQASDQPKIEDLYKDKLLKKANVLTYANFTQTKEADVEDMFGDDFYVSLVNAEFTSQLPSPITLDKLTSKSPRILPRIEQYLAQNPLSQGQFGHYRPARYFNENLKTLKMKLPNEVKERFAAAFEAVNALLK